MNRHRIRTMLLGAIAFLGLPGVLFADTTITESPPEREPASTFQWDDAPADPQLIPDPINPARSPEHPPAGISAGAGTLTVSNGDMIVRAAHVRIGDRNAGTVDLKGGTLGATGLEMGAHGGGTINISGGSFSVGAMTIPGVLPGGPASCVISGGTLTLSSLMTLGDTTHKNPGTLTIEGGAGSLAGANGGRDGAIRFTNQSTLVIRPDGPASLTNLTRIEVGSVNLDTGATLEFDPQYSPQPGDAWDIILSQNTLGGTEGSGKFTNVVLPEGFAITQSLTVESSIGPEKLTVTVTAVPETSLQRAHDPPASETD